MTSLEMEPRSNYNSRPANFSKEPIIHTTIQQSEQAKKMSNFFRIINFIWLADFIDNLTQTKINISSAIQKGFVIQPTLDKPQKRKL